MNRSLLIAGLLITLVFTASADRRRLMMARSSATTACSTVHAQNGAASTGNINIGNGANNYFGGQGDYNPGANITVCKIDWTLTKVTGSVSGKTFVCVIYTQDGSDNLTTLHGTSDPVTGSDSWSSTVVSFTFSTPVSLSTGGNYAIALTMNESDTLNYVGAARTANGQISGDNFGWQSSLAYGTFANNDMLITIYKQ